MGSPRGGADSATFSWRSWSGSSAANNTPAGSLCRRDFAASANHAQPGDPLKFAAGIVTLANAENPPLRMPFGSDTVAKLGEKNAFVEQELSIWRELAVSTDFTA